MPIYQGDNFSFSLSITHADGSLPSVTTSPTLQIIYLVDGSSVLGSPASMTSVSGTNDQLWTYTWSIGTVQNGQYMAIVSYAADGNTYNSIPLEKVTIGDSRILGAVALDSTVAKAADVALDSTVAHATDVIAISPETSPTILSIKAKTDLIPADPTSMTLLATPISQVADIWDSELGSQTIDKTQNPAKYTKSRVGGGTLATYDLTDDATTSQRVKN